jgi:lysophospholipase L1-like esterase
MVGARGKAKGDAMRLMCFGDSNTHGTPPIAAPGEQDRFPAGVRWPTRVAAALGWDLVEEGLPGRTAAFPDVVMGDHMDGRVGLKVAMNSHKPLDFLTIMLGTNDVKTRFGATPEMIAGGIAGLLDYALGAEQALKHPGLKILLIAPAPVQETGWLGVEFWGGAAKSRALAPLLRDLAASRGIGFLDAGPVWAVSPVDGVHFAAGAHADMAAAVTAALRRLSG